MRVLVIEDEPRLAATLQDLLELEGYTADVRHDGEAGLDDALSSIYDVILLDVMLPKLDGFTVLRRLREAGADGGVYLPEAVLHRLRLGGDVVRDGLWGLAAVVVLLPMAKGAAAPGAGPQGGLPRLSQDFF